MTEPASGSRAGTAETLRSRLATTVTVLAVVVGAGTVVWAAVVTARIVGPSPDTPAPADADAVVVLAGGGDRIARGVGLVTSGVADELVITSTWNAGPGVWSARPCNTGARPVPDRVRVACVEPRPGTTRGEARLVARLARRRGWRSLVLVVSRDQARRARTLLERCWDGTITVVTVDHDEGLLRRLPHEWGAWFVASVDRRC